MKHQSVRKMIPTSVSYTHLEEEFDAIADTITDPVNRKRAKHAVYENQRTIRAVEALKKMCIRDRH